MVGRENPCAGGQSLFIQCRLPKLRRRELITPLVLIDVYGLLVTHKTEKFVVRGCFSWLIPFPSYLLDDLVQLYLDRWRIETALGFAEPCHP